MIKRALNKLFQNKNQVWTLYAQLARMVSGFASVGLLARGLPSDILGTWYIFVSIFGIASLIEMGLGQVIGRHAAYLKADYDRGRINSVDFLKFVMVGERFYFVVITVIGIIAIPVGVLWLGHLQGDWNLPKSLLIAWVAYVCGGLLTMLGAYYAAVVNGTGDMWRTQQAAIFGSAMNVSILLTLLMILPSALIIPALTMLLSQLWLVVRLRKTLFGLEITSAAGNKYYDSTIDTSKTARFIATDAGKMLLIMVSYQLLTNGFVLVLSKHLRQDELGSYGLTMQLIGVVMSISMIWSQSNFYEIAATRKCGEALLLRKIFFSGLARALGVTLLGMLGLYLLASPLLELLGSKTGLLPPLLLTAVLGAVWLEFGFTQFSHLLIARGDMRVAYLSLFASVNICGATILLLSFGYTIISVFIARIILFFLLIGLPVLVISRRLFRIPTTTEL